MELRVIRYFLAVANKKNISSAANALHISQPTLSRQLKDLEDELGVTLFIRGNRHLTLTEEGILLKKRANEIIALIDKTECELRTPEKLISGTLYIGGGETRAMSVVAQVMKEMNEEYPDLHYHFFSGNVDDVAERLDKGLLDFGLMIEPFNESQYESLRLPYTDIWGLLTMKDDSLSTKDFISPEDMLHLPLITSRRTLVKDAISSWLGYDYNLLNVIATFNLIFNASIMAETNLGHVLTIDGLVPTGEDSKFDFIPLNPKLESHMHLVWKKGQLFSNAAEEFLKRLECHLDIQSKT